MTRALASAAGLACALVCAATAVACVAQPSGACAADDECPQDAECRAGVCTPIADDGEGDASEGDASEGDGAEGDGAEGDGGDTTCSLDDDELSDADMAVALGLPIRTLDATSSAADIAVDVDGDVVDGVRTWDFTPAVPDETAFALEADPLAEQWFADEIDDAVPFVDGHGTYVAPLSADVLGVFENSASELVLRAIASTDADRTLIQYDPPILVLALPLHEGDTFSSESTGGGTYEFNPFYVSSDAYASTVDARGLMHTLAGDFPVLRVKVAQSVTVGFVNVSRIQYVWLTPCLGVVAQVESADGETDPSFTDASHVRRLAAP